MYNNKYLLFSTGNGTADPLNWDSSEAALYNVQDFEGMKPSSAQTIDMFFRTSKGKEIVTLGIKNGSHVRVMSALGNALVTGKQAIVPVVDVDNGNFIHKDIHSATIKAYTLSVQKLSGTGQVKIDTDHSPTSMTLCATATAVIDLYLVDKTGNDLTDTTINAAEAEAASTSSVTLNVDGTVPTNDRVLNERIYKSDGTFFGVATSWTDASPDTIVFSGGLENAIADDDDLYRGTRYYILHTLSIPLGSTLKLEGDEVNFPIHKYDLYAKLDSGVVQVTTRY